ncbi:MAG: hypothetical protein A3A89_00795 [Candidatus Magasanikbacteria bacterium RIFCSPLOWO2_01_FULL_33_34]|nr:MAG: hypothetical protein A3A89_00795 [Candidatus Magasanikbacteria bacterium RIFCSPLOWO2_01_FULL_33_34]
MECLYVYMLKCLNKRGFSLVEILLVVSTASILVVGGFVSYRSFVKRLELNTSVNDVISALHLASERTLSSKENDQYGVRFEPTYYAIYKGFDWDVNDPNNEVFYFSDNVEYTDIWGNTFGVSVVFDRITGKTDHVGDIILRLVDDNDENRVIKISPSGRVGLAGTINLTDTRVIDSRHIHFALGWSLQGASDLELHFDDTVDVDETVVMADYFNPDETEFDWTGTIDVNGEPQTLRVHTHSLDEFDTVLCIHRDGRYNTKMLDVSVDGNAIASFTADGVPSVGVFGGTMSIQ